VPSQTGVSARLTGDPDLPGREQSSQTGGRDADVARFVDEP
jgi:hypothetical protein